MVIFMEWTEYKLKEYLEDKQNRSVHYKEYLLLIGFIKKIQPDTIIDIGTFMGASGHILGTCCDSIKNIYSIDNINSSEYVDKEETSKKEHGKYLPEGSVFLTDGYNNNLEKLIKLYPNAFVFWDAGKNTIKVIGQLELSYNNNIKYIALHDTGLRRVRRAINRAINLGWYTIVSEDITSCPNKGVTILKKQ